MTVLVAALSLLMLSPAPYADGDKTLRDTTLRDTVVRDTLPGQATHPVGIARPDTVLPLPRVTVTATRGRAVPAVEAPARVTVLGRRAIEASGAPSVAGLLEERSGAFVRRYGSGGTATLSLRGAGAAQSLVLLGGHRIADPQLGQLDFTLLPTLLLESVEVMHGAGSALYGTDAVGGVVNLRPRVSGSAPVMQARAAYGAYGERSGSLLASGRAGRFSGVTVGEYRRTEGDFPYTNEALLPPQEVRRRNADRRRLTLFSTGRYDGEDVRLRGGAWYTGAERGLPGTAATAPTGERQWDEAVRLWGGARTRVAWGRLRVGGLLQHKALRYKNPERDVDDTGRTLIGSLRATLRADAGPRWRLSGGLSSGFGRARHPSLAASAREWRGGAFLGGTGRYGRLRLYPMLRADAYFPTGSDALFAVSPKLGANWEAVSFGEEAWLGRGALHLKASVGRAFRRPTFNDRFWQPGGNLSLEPERGWSAEAGLAFDQPRRQAEMTLFARRMREEIVWRPSSEGYYAPINVRRVRVLGAEASLRRRWRLSQNAELGSGLFYTFTDARNRSNPGGPAFDEPLRYVPRHQLKAHAQASVGAFSLTVNARYTGRRYANSDGTRALDPFVVADVGISAGQEVAGVRAELSLQVDNFLNTDYAVLQNRPLPPRHAQLELMLRPGGE